MKVQRKELSIELLKSLLRYEPHSGLLYWRKFPDRGKAWNTKYAGKLAFNADHATGYKWGTVCNDQFLAHRVAWAIHYGEWPEVVDHVNGDRTDNRIENLRSVSQRQNAMNSSMSKNNTSGFCGVYWSSHWKRWKAVIGSNYHRKHIATSECIAVAVIARHLAEIEHGYHPNHGRSGN